MPEFDWQAANDGGQMFSGRMAAEHEPGVVRRLRSDGLTPVSVVVVANPGQPIKVERLVGSAPAAPAPLTEPKPVGVWPSIRRQPLSGRVLQSDVLSLTTELAIMLRAGLSLDNALRVLAGMSHKMSVSQLTQNVLNAVKGGAPLSHALGAHRQLFGDFYINMVRSGEASGQLANVMDRLVEHMERLRSLRDQLISATIYPAVLLGVAVVSLVAMLGFVVPQFEKLFSDMGDALPTPTRIVMHLGQAFTQYGLFMSVGFFLAAALLLKLAQTERGQVWRQQVLLRLPLVGSLLRKYELTLFTRSLGTLLGNGVPLLVSLSIATDTIGSPTLRAQLSAVAPAVKEGAKVVSAVDKTQVFEPLAINLIRVGEETGRIGPMMLEIANIYNREVETGIKRVLTLVEPLLIVVLGLLIASIIVSILLGILSINDLAG